MARELQLQGSVRIVHIDDNAENRLLVRVILEPRGYEVIDAVDGESGIEAVLRERPALVLVDVNLPGMDGCEVAMRLKARPELSTVPVVALTAYAMSGDRDRILGAGCDGYIEKPIDVDAFHRQIGAFVHRR